MKDGNDPELYDRKKSRVKTNARPDYIDLSHSSFDNDIEVIEDTLKKITGSNRLKVKVVNLCGY